MHLFRKDSFASFLMLLAPVTFVLAAWGMLMKQEPFYSWFYPFAWWSYILFLEAFLFRCGGKSDLFSAPGRFLIYLPLSITIWLVLEAFNFRLGNWRYLELPSSTPLRWFGYAISFATVLPGLFATNHFLQYAGIAKSSRCSSLISPRALYGPLLFAGAATFFLPLLWPEYFFALIWGAFIFLLEPINHRFGAPSLLDDWRRGSLRNFYLLLITGGFCGLLWEFWNFWAGSKWVYTIPFVGTLKVFEMPILGFLGFPPFAVECYVMVNAFFMVKDRINRNRPARQQRLIWFILTVAMILFDIFVFLGIDHFTVISFKE